MSKKNFPWLIFLLKTFSEMVFEAQKPVMSGTCAWKLSEWKYPKLAIVSTDTILRLYRNFTETVLRLYQTKQGSIRRFWLRAASIDEGGIAWAVTAIDLGLAEVPGGRLGLNGASTRHFSFLDKPLTRDSWLPLGVVRMAIPILSQGFKLPPRCSWH